MNVLIIPTQRLLTLVKCYSNTTVPIWGLTGPSPRSVEKQMSSSLWNHCYRVFYFSDASTLSMFGPLGICFLHLYLSCRFEPACFSNVLSRKSPRLFASWNTLGNDVLVPASTIQQPLYLSAFFFHLQIAHALPSTGNVSLYRNSYILPD